jgi:hypothetical protein
MMRMIAQFSAMGIVEARLGVKNDADFPEIMFVESLGPGPLKAVADRISRFLAAPQRPLSRFELAGWSSEEQFEAFRRVRVRYE